MNDDYLSKNYHLMGRVQAVPIFAYYTLAFALELRKKHGKTSVTVVVAV